VSAQALPAAGATAAPAAGDRTTAERPIARMWPLVLGCLALAALSLLTPSAPTYDPWAWIIWGREIVHWDLVTTGGPSWKPLPVLFTAPFALVGDDAAPALWLVIARAGGLLAFVMAFRLAARLAGPWAGLISAASLFLADEFIRNFVRGNSEGLLVGLVLWAVERHLDGRRIDAFLLGFGAALLRPEIWPFWGAYGLWLLWTHRSWGTLWIVGGSGVAALILWFLPEYLGSGDWMRAASRAREPNPDSAAFASSPFVEVFRRSASILSPPVYAGAVIATLFAVQARRRDFTGRLTLTLGVIGTVLMIAVGLMTEAGFAGNLRYVALPAAMLCILAGAGWVWAVRVARERWGGWAAGAAAVLIVAVSLPFLAADRSALAYQWGRQLREADLYGPNLRWAIERAGGQERLKQCGQVYTGIFQVPSVAWYLHLHINEIGIFPEGPGTTLATRFSPLSVDPRYPTFAETNKWLIGTSCSDLPPATP
jgi:hypothetical protein